MVSRSAAADALDGVAAIAATIGLLVEDGLRSDGNPVSASHLALALGTGAALAPRRRAPVPSFVATVALTLAGLPVLHATRVAVLVVIVSAATVAHERRRRVAVLAGLALIPCVGLGIFEASDPGTEWTTFLLYLLVLLSAVAGGDALRSRRDAAVARAASTEAHRAAQAQALFDERRMNLARDLHDTVAHALVAINTQAGVAAHVHAGDAEPGLVATLTDIKQASADALAELRATVHELRTNSGTDGRASLGEGELAALSRPLRAHGVEVAISTPTAVIALPQPVVRAGYRIIQESLTNVLRHAAATSVRVDLELAPQLLTITVRDNGSAPAAGRDRTSGHGLVGMSERASALGGSVTAGPAAPHGWLVSARLPTAVVGS